ncbi:EpsG family protein [Acinetobacter guillouiae]|uniref:EpsG family protein n=1 Tax=Acinetobacter guillouiae TaxID=106649 RepID=UPI0021CE9FF7|nr:EpsG family protein [Acinetobacter guillouiae]MCU4494117.1 EpsG family protein [Acinetobacter guillouiae]
MVPYFALLFAISFATLFDGKKVDKLIFFILAIWMLIFSAFRVGGTGTGDYDAYLRLYTATDTLEKVINPEIHAEIGFRLLSFFGHSFGFGEQYIIVAMAALALLPVTYIVYKYSPYKILSLLIWMPYFLAMNMQTSRTSVAAAFGLLFMVQYYQKRWVIALLSLCIAVSFHSSALILILVFLARVSLKKLFYATIVAFSMLLFVSPFEILLKLFEILHLTRLSDFLLSYLASDDYGYPMALYDPRIVLALGVVFLIFKCQNHIPKYFDMYYCKLYIIGALLMVVFSHVVIMAWRVSYLFLLISVITIPWLAKLYNILIQQNIGAKRVMSSIFILLYFLYTASLIFKAQPYVFIW